MTQHEDIARTRAFLSDEPYDATSPTGVGLKLKELQALPAFMDAAHPLHGETVDAHCILVRQQAELQAGRDEAAD